MGTNKVKGVITLVIGLVLIIIALVILIISMEANWVVGGIGGIGITDIVFAFLIMFQKTPEEIIDKYLSSNPSFDLSHKDEVKDTVQFVSPEELSAPSMNFDPNTGAPLK